MNYSTEHLKIAYNAGVKNFPFEQTIEFISQWDVETASKIIDSLSGPPSYHHHRRKNNGSNPQKSESPLSKDIISFLKEKGSEGAHVKDIAEAVGARLSSVRVWFYNMGRGYVSSGEIKKVARATFCYCAPTKLL